MSQVARAKRPAKAAVKRAAPKGASLQHLTNTLKSVLNSKRAPAVRPRPAPKKRGAGFSGSMNDPSTFPSSKMGGNGKRRFIIVEWDEYVAEVAGSVSFATTAYPLNPGQSSLFPWLSKMAGLWEKYEFESCAPYYKHEVSQYATNGQAGKVMLSCDYDASDTAPLTKQQVEDTWPHIDCMPYQDVSLPLNRREMRSSVAMKYVRPGAQPANTDIKIYDAGVVYVSTYGNTNTSVVGELRIRYRVRLEVPVLEAASIVSSNYAHFAGTTPTTANNLATAVIGTGSTFTPVLGTNTITFPSTVVNGNYLVTVVLRANTTATSGPTITLTSGASALTLFANSGSVDVTSQVITNGSTPTIVTSTVAITVTGPSAVLTLTPVTLTTGNAVDVIVAQIPTGSLTVGVAPVEDRLAALERCLSLRRADGDSVSNFQCRLANGSDEADEKDQSSSSSSSSVTNYDKYRFTGLKFTYTTCRCCGSKTVANEPFCSSHCAKSWAMCQDDEFDRCSVQQTPPLTVLQQGDDAVVRTGSHKKA
jgi:hypothetical protein